MDSIDDGASSVAEEDRLSKLPDKIIHHILSFIDMRNAIQTCILSRKWKNIWTSMPRLNINTSTFFSTFDYGKFVVKALSHRNNRAEVSGLELTFCGATTQSFVQNIVNYAYLKNVKQMTMNWYYRASHVLPQFFFSSHTLKHLTLEQFSSSRIKSCVPKSDWDLPALETLNLRNIRLGDVDDKSISLFSKCVNLKDLNLERVFMHGVEIFNVCAPKLLNLTATHSVTFPKVFNVVAPKLESLTAPVITRGTSPTCYSFLRLSEESFDSLEKVNLSAYPHGKYKKELLFPHLLYLFRILRHARYLIIDNDIIESLSSCLEQLSDEPCPFDNLNCLKINTEHVKRKDRIATIDTQVRKYFLENSPSATFMMRLPEVILKLKEKIRLQDQNIEKLNAKIQLQDQDIEKLKEKFGAQSLQHDKLASHFIKCKVAELKVQVERGNPDYLVIRSIGRNIKDLIPGSLKVDVEATFSSQYEKLKSLLLTSVKACQWADIEKWLGIHRYCGKFRFYNSDSQSPFSYHYRSRQQVPNDIVAKKVVAKLEEEIKRLETMAQEEKLEMQDEVIANHKAKLRKQDEIIAKRNAELQKQDQIIGKLEAMLEKQYYQHIYCIKETINCKVAELKMQVESGNPDYEVICSMGYDIKDLMTGSYGDNVKTQFSSKYEELKSLLLKRINASQWEKIESELWNSRSSENFSSNRSHSLPVVFVAELLPEPRPSSDIVTQKRSRPQVPKDTMANKVAKLETVEMQPETMLQEKRMLEEKIRMQDQLIARQKIDLQLQFQVTGQQKAEIEMQDQLIARLNANLQMQDQVIGNVHAMMGERNSQHEKLISHFIKCKMAELKLQFESGNPDYQVIRSIGCDIKDLVPGSLRLNLETQESSKYEELKSLLLSHIDARQWAMIESVLRDLSSRFPSNSYQSVVRGAECPPVPRPSSDNKTTYSRLVRR